MTDPPTQTSSDISNC